MERALSNPHRAARLRLAALGALLLGLFAVATLSGRLPDPDAVRDWGDGLGAAGPALYVVAGALLLSAFVPSAVVAGAAGLLFGTAGGTPVALIAAVLGAVLQMSVTRHVAGDAAAHLLPERVRRIDEFIARRGFWAVLYVRLAPAIPYTLVNYGAGLTRLRLRDMAGGTAVGAAPRTFAWVALGGSIDDLGAPEARVAIAVLVAIAVVGAVVARRQLALERSA